MTDKVDVVVELSDSVIARSLKPPFKYDEMGNPKQYTKEELKELRGNNPRIPGYKLEMVDVTPGAIVKVTLAKNKTTGNQLKAVMVVVVDAGSAPVDTGKKGRKKKK